MVRLPFGEIFCINGVKFQTITCLKCKNLIISGKLTSVSKGKCQILKEEKSCSDKICENFKFIGDLENLIKINDKYYVKF